MFKPFLATDADLDKIKYPVIVMPKIDGVRALNRDFQLVGRSLKPIRNNYTRQRFSQTWMDGFDGELAAEFSTHPDLCRLTTSATSTIDNCPDVRWHIFDIVSPTIKDLPYAERLQRAGQIIRYARENDLPFSHDVSLVPSKVVYCEQELLDVEAQYLEEGYEGIILRDPTGAYKYGRSTVKEGGYLRIKRFVLAEAVVTGIVEGNRNDNPALTNELGHTYRTTHQENMVGNGMVGSLECTVRNTVVEWGKQVLVAGQEITVSPGCLTHSQRTYFFENPNEIVGQKVMFKFFPIGMKDKPRFPTFVSFA